MSSASIILLDSGSPSGEEVANVLNSVGHEVTRVTTVPEAVAAAAGHTLVIVGVLPGGQAALACALIRQAPELVSLPILCIAQSDDVEERVRFLEAGADDVLASPFDPRELEARMEALLIRLQRSRDLAPSLIAEPRATPRRSVIVVFSPKGGVGTTTIAVNLAAWLATQLPGRAAIADFDIQFGQVATLLNVKPRLTLADLAGDEQAMHEPDLMRTYADRDSTGLTVFASPLTPEHGQVITAQAAERFVDTARVAFETLVIDAGSEVDDRSLTLLERAESVVIPIVPEIAALKALGGLMRYLAEGDPVVGKTTFVVNHLFAREMLSVRQVESFIGAKGEIDLPYDAALYLKAANEGVPVVRGAPGSGPAKALVRLAAQVSGIDTPVVKGGHEDRGRKGLSGILHRA